MSRTALYRFFDAEGDLLYVGISLNPLTRWQQHKGDKEWIEDVVTTTYEWFDTRDEAICAERDAIVAESPRHNVAHRVKTGAVTPLLDIELSYLCYRCDEPITRRGSGVLRCDLEEAVHLRRRQLNYAAEHWTHLDAVTEDDWINACARWMPGPTVTMGGEWRPAHRKCVKHPAWQEFPKHYDVDIDEVRTIGDLIAVGEMLSSGVDWFAYTDWLSFLHGAITGDRHAEPAYLGIALDQAIDLMAKRIATGSMRDA